MAARESEEFMKKKLTALIVDDTCLARHCEEALLKKHGFVTVTVENGEKVVNLFVAGQYFDIVIIDMQMPVMNGIQATKEIRAMGMKSLIFGVTASDDESDIQAFKKAGLDECFEKPLNYVKIEKIFERLKNNYK